MENDTKSTPSSMSCRYEKSDIQDEESVPGAADDEADRDVATVESTGASSFQAFLHLLKGNVGPGCLSLPWAFSTLGTPLGAAAVFLLGVLTGANGWSVVMARRKWFGLPRPDGAEVTYSDVGERAYGTKFRKYVTASIMLQQLAVCTIFFSFIADNTAALASEFFLDGAALTNYRVCVTLVLPAAMALSCVPNLKALGFAIKIATGLLFSAFFFIGVVVIKNWGDYSGAKTNETDEGRWSSTVPIAICAVMYSYEGISLVLPVESAMQKPESFARPYGLGLVGMIIIFTAFPSFCVAAFGTVDDGSITAFLLNNRDKFEGDSLVLVANLLVSISVLFTYPLQLFPCIGLVNQLWKKKPPTTTSGKDGVSENGTYATIGGTNLEVVEESTNELASRSAPMVAKKFLQKGSSNSKVSKKGNYTTLGVTIVEDEEECINKLASASVVGKDVAQTATVNENGAENDSYVTLGGNTLEDEESPNELVSASMVRNAWENLYSPLLRTFLVLVTYLVAVTVPNVQELISLAGAVAGSSVALIIPPIIELKTLPEGQRIWSLSALKCYCLLLVGLIFGIYGSVASIQDIIHVYQMSR